MKGIIVKIEKPIDDKLKYIMWKCSDDKTLLSEKLDIIDFLINHVGLFGDELNPERFMKELNKLTVDISHEPKKE